MLEKLTRSDLLELAVMHSIVVAEDETKTTLAEKIADAIQRAASATVAVDDAMFYADDVDRQFIESDDVLLELAELACFDLMHLQVYDKLSTVRTSETCSRCAQTSLSTMTTANSVIVKRVFKTKKNEKNEDVVTDKIDEARSTYRFDDLKRRSICTQCLLRKATLRQYLERYIVQHRNVVAFRAHAYAAYSIIATRSNSLSDALQRVNNENDDNFAKLVERARAASDIAKEIATIDESKREAALAAIASLREQQTERAARFESKRARVAAQFAAR